MMDYTKKRWRILWISCLVNLCVGTGYAWSVFAGPLAARINQIQGFVGTAAVTPGELALAFTVFSGVGVLFMIGGGWLNDHFAPKWIIFVGAFFFGGGFFMLGFAETALQVIIYFGVLLGVGLGLVYNTVVTNTVRFFPDKRGLVGGLTTAIYGLGSVVLPPIANSLIVSSGVTRTCNYIGIVFIAIIVLGAFLIPRCPEGFLPAGWTPPAPTTHAKATVDKNWLQMIADPIFWVMFVILVAGAFFGLMCISQASPIAQNLVGMTAATAAVVVSVLALFNVFGRLASGVISDWIGRINTLAIVMVLAVIGSFLLLTTGNSDIVKFYIGICLIGFAFGSLMGVYPGFCADQFGIKYQGVNYGILFIAFALAGYFGPVIMKNTYATNGTYTTAFMYCIILAIVGLIFTFIFRPMVKGKKKLEAAPQITDPQA